MTNYNYLPTRPASTSTSAHRRCGHCGESLPSVPAFAAHRTGPLTDRACLDDAAMRDAGLSKDRAEGAWKVARKEQTQPAAAVELARPIWMDWEDASGDDGGEDDYPVACGF